MKTQLLTLTILLLMTGLARGHGELLPEPDPEAVIAALTPMILAQVPEQGRRDTQIVVTKLASSIKKLPKNGPIPEGRVLPRASQIAAAPMIFNEVECEMIDVPRPTTPQAARALRKLEMVGHIAGPTGGRTGGKMSDTIDEIIQALGRLNRSAARQKAAMRKTRDRAEQRDYRLVLFPDPTGEGMAWFGEYLVSAPGGKFTIARVQCAGMLQPGLSALEAALIMQANYPTSRILWLDRLGGDDSLHEIGRWHVLADGAWWPLMDESTDEMQRLQ